MWKISGKILIISSLSQNQFWTAQKKLFLY
jgi:hypothetical protein